LLQHLANKFPKGAIVNEAFHEAKFYLKSYKNIHIEVKKMTKDEILNHWSQYQESFLLDFGLSKQQWVIFKNFFNEYRQSVLEKHDVGYKKGNLSRHSVVGCARGDNYWKFKNS
jgi:hypothetical protein